MYITLISSILTTVRWWLNQLFRAALSLSASPAFITRQLTTHRIRLQKCHRYAKSTLILLLVSNSLKCSDRFPWWGWHYPPQEKAFSTRHRKTMWVPEAFQLEPNTLRSSKHWTSQSPPPKSKSGEDTSSLLNNTTLMQVSRASLNLKITFFLEVRFRPHQTIGRCQS